MWRIKKSFIGIETKSENKSRTNEYKYFLDSNFVGVNELFVFVYSNKDADCKIFKNRRYYLPKGAIKHYNIINGKIFYDQEVDSDMKRHEEVKKLTAWEDEDYTTGFLLDYDYIKSYYKLIAVDLSRRKGIRCRS